MLSVGQPKRQGANRVRFVRTEDQCSKLDGTG